jgi:hypothetical protein
MLLGGSPAQLKSMFHRFLGFETVYSWTVTFRRAHTMPAKNDFDADAPLPCFLADNPEQQGVDKACQTAVISTRVLKASIGAIAATAIGIAILALGNPFTLVAEVSASLLHRSAPQPATDNFTPEQSIAAAQASQLSDEDRPKQEESPEAAYSPIGTIEVGSQSLLRHFQVWAADRDAQVGPVEHIQDVAERVTVNSHFRHFETWAAEKDAQVNVESSLQSVQGDKALVVKEAPAQDSEKARTSPRPTEPRRHVRSVENARAELRPAHNARTVRREQNAKAQNRSAEARAPR